MEANYRLMLPSLATPCASTRQGKSRIPPKEAEPQCRKVKEMFRGRDITRRSVISLLISVDGVWVNTLL